MTEQKSVTITRTFSAPVEAVFRAWTDPAHASQWMKCDPGVDLELEQWQPETGARYATTMTKPGEWSVSTTGEFLEVDPPHLLVYRSDAQPDRGFPAATVRVELAAVDGGTQLTLTHSGLPGEEMCSIVEGGWTNGLRMLEQMLQIAAG